MLFYLGKTCVTGARKKLKKQNSVIHIRYASGDTRKILILVETSLDNTFCHTISK